MLKENKCLYTVHTQTTSWQSYASTVPLHFLCKFNVTKCHQSLSVITLPDFYMSKHSLEISLESVKSAETSFFQNFFFLNINSWLQLSSGEYCMQVGHFLSRELLCMQSNKIQTDVRCHLFSKIMFFFSTFAIRKKTNKRKTKKEQPRSSLQIRH